MAANYQCPTGAGMNLFDFRPGSKRSAHGGRRWVLPLALAVTAACLAAASGGRAQQPVTGAPHLTQAVICEDIQNQRSINAGWVFPVSVGKIHCLTSFDHIAETQFVIHRWYFRDNPVATFRLALQPPRWSTFSSLQIRNLDKGPWRVTITDTEGRLIKELRFSVGD